MMAQLGERRGIKHGMKSAALAWRGMLEGTINPAKGESMTDQETPERAHVTADDIEAANDLIDFIEACPSMFHTAATIMAELDEAGFAYLPENAAWDIEPGGRYYTQRNTSSVVAFKVGEDLAATWGEDGVAGDYHFQLTASHSDSPTFKVKAVPELDGAGETLRLELRIRNPYPYAIRMGADDTQLVMLWKHGRFRVDEFPTGETFTIPADSELTRGVTFTVLPQLAGETFDVGFALRREGYTNWFNGKPLRTEVAR